MWFGQVFIEKLFIEVGLFSRDSLVENSFFERASLRIFDLKIAYIADDRLDDIDRLQKQINQVRDTSRPLV